MPTPPVDNLPEMATSAPRTPGSRADDDGLDELRAVLARLGVTEAGFRSLVEQMPVVVYIEAAGSVSRTIYVAPGIETLLGSPPADWIGREGIWLEHVHPDDAPSIQATAEGCDRTGEPFRADYRMLTVGGDVRWIHEESSLLRDEAGAPVCWQGYLQDVTDRALADRALAEAERSYRTLVETIPAVSYVEEHLGDTFFYVSPQLRTILGYDPATWTPVGWRDALHPDDRDWVLEKIGRAGETGEAFSQEYRVFAADGRTVWVRDEAVLVRDDEGMPAMWQGVLFDVTEHKDAEGRLRHAEARYRSVVENSPAALYVEDLDPDSFGTVYASPQIEQITGHPAQAWIDDRDLWLKVIHPDDLEAVMAAEERCVTQGVPFDMDVRMVRPDGSVVWVHDRAVLVEDERGAPLFWQGFFLDVTEKKKAEQELAWALELERESAEQLRVLDGMKDMFLTAVSHELRSPIAAILGSAMTLEQLDATLSPLDRHGLVGGIIAKARRLEQLVRDLLDLERVRRGAAEVERVPTDLAMLAAQAIEASGLRERHPVVEDLAPSILAVDASMIARVLENLLSNADRYTPAGSTVWVRVRSLDDDAEIVVEDEGPGVPVDAREVLFEPFRQGEHTVAHSPGVGVGLSIVAKFAELHGGRAWVEERHGGGASFHVLLAGVRTAG